MICQRTPPKDSHLCQARAVGHIRWRQGEQSASQFGAEHQDFKNLTILKHYKRDPPRLSLNQRLKFVATPEEGGGEAIKMERTPEVRLDIMEVAALTLSGMCFVALRSSRESPAISLESRSAWQPGSPSRHLTTSARSAPC